jgi:hypothetical protein
VGKKSTRFKIVFCGLLLVAFIAIQFSWIRSLQKDKLLQFRNRMATAIGSIAGNKPFEASLHELADTAITSLLRNSFSLKGFDNLRFEYAVALHNKQFASAGFNQKQKDQSNLILHYVLRYTGQIDEDHSGEILTIVVPKKTALKELTWIIVASVLLTVMIMAVFCSVYYFNYKSRQSAYGQRTALVKNMMQQMESPLSTVSVAADALRNAKVMHDEVKVNYYQQIITEESKRMNEQVEKFLRDLK